ncbi:FeoA family protein [Mobilicoccus massiliensis]|uniref:FeoA family protein n=1 Tax=Mobilicoccus massiliensis TaxID=1522310 RepID=UPI0009E460E4|nr:FeoA family protein [Mobilicoccus massiliensis]
MSEFATLIARREIPTGTAAPALAEHTPRTRGLLRRRRPAAGTLAALPVGARAIVAGVGGDLDPAAARRLVDLGFAPGALVEVLRRAPLSDPTIFRVADTEIALRRRHAAAIRIDAPLA